MRLLIALLTLAALPAAAQTPVAKGVYRLPYPDGVEVSIGNDHSTHSPTRNRLDMTATQTGQTIVAAAAGVVRIVEADNSTVCLRPPSSLLGFDSDTDGRLSSAEIHAAITSSPANSNTVQTAANNLCASYSGTSANCCMRGLERTTPPARQCSWAGASSSGTCGAGADGQGPNNYIWIEHPNGEWTKYTHIRTNSALVSVGQNVIAGQPLGLEGDVGIASGRHVHFEVAGIDSADEIGAQGWLNDVDSAASANLRNRVPVFCQLGVLSQGATVTSVSCDDACGNATETVGGNVNSNNAPMLVQATSQVTTNANIAPGSGLATRAGQRIKITPGFRAAGGSFFSAEIGACDAPGGTGDG